MPNPDKLHGNRAKVPKNAKIEPLYATNTVTMSDEEKDGSPMVSDDNVSYARKFQEENKK